MKLTMTAVVVTAVAALTGVAALPGLGATTPSVRAPGGSTAGLTVRLTADGCHAAGVSATTLPANALDAVQFVSSTTGWVAGANRILATTDGGAHWRTQLRQPDLGLTEVDAIDHSHVWVVGADGLLASRNGGRTWRRLPEPCPEITSVHFISPARGYAVAGGRLLASGNSGSSWHRIHAPGAAQSVCFTSTQRGWLGAHGRIYRTVDGARTWTRVVRGAQSGAKHDYPVAEVQCAGSDAGWAELVGPGVGSSQQEHVAYHLHDRGSRGIFAEQYFQGPHSTVTRNSPGAYFAAFSSIDPGDAAFVDTCAPCGRGTSPVDIATAGGRELTKAGNVGHLSFAFGAAYVSTTDGWVVGSTNHLKGRPTWKIVHTTNGGRNWAIQYVE